VIELKQKKKTLKIISIILICVIVGSGMYLYLKSKNSVSAETSSIFNEATVARGNIAKSVTGSSVIESKKRQEIKYDKAGTVEKVFVEGGQKVEEGDVILTLESSSENISLEISQRNLELERNEYQDLINNLSDLKIYATADGVIEMDELIEGDTLQSGAIFGTVINKNVMEISTPYNSSVVKNIKVGQSAKVFFPDNFTTVDGTVKKVASIGEASSDSGSIYYYVTIEFNNPGGLSADMLGQATVITDNGSYQAIENVAITEKDGSVVWVETSGEIQKLYVENGDYVKKGTLLAVLESDSLLKEIENKKLTLEQKELEMSEKLEDLEDVAITAPISGTILELYAADGDNVDMGDSVCVIADTEDLLVTLSIDELDVFDILKGQEAVITTEVFPEMEYSGSVYKIAMEGKYSNGVSTFDVEVALNDIENLRLGMSVDVEIVIDSAENVLLLPVEAIQKRGTKNVVMVGNITANSDVKLNTQENFKTVEIGLSSEDYVEIISGLEEGDTVYYSSQISTNDNQNMGGPGMMMPMGGGRPQR
jgi:HlyD family secretion protein